MWYFSRQLIGKVKFFTTRLNFSTQMTFKTFFLTAMLAVLISFQLSAQCEPYPCAPCTFDGTATPISNNCGQSFKIIVNLDLPVGHVASYVIKKAGHPASIPVNTTSPTYTFSNLGPGTYYVWAIDLNTGCIWTGECEFLGPFDTWIDFGSFCDGTNYVCPYAVGGTQPYTYVWSDGYVSVFDGCRYNLPAGNYSVTISDGSGNSACKKVESATVYNWQNPVITTTTKNPTCLKSNGEIKVTVTGAGPFNITMVGPNFNQSGSNFTGLAPGNYTINVIDANGCTSSKNVQLQNSGVPTIIKIDTASCVPISLFGTVFEHDTMFTILGGLNSFGCPSDTFVTIEISDTLTGPTTTLVVCPGGVTLNGVHYSTSGQYEIFDFMNNCPRKSILDLTVLDLTATVVHHFPVCEEKADSIAYLVTGDGCPYSEVFVYDVVQVQDSILNLETCDIKFADSTKVETRYNIAGCPYLYTTSWCFQPVLKTKSEATCIDVLVGTTQVDTTEENGCTVFTTTVFYKGAGSWAFKAATQVCENSVVVLAGQPFTIVSDSLLEVTTIGPNGCELDSVQYVYLQIPEKDTIWLMSCNPAMKDSVKVEVGPGDCPDTTETRYVIYELPDQNTSQPTCFPSLVGKTITTTQWTTDGCPYKVHTLYYGKVSETITTEQKVCAGSEIVWRGKIVTITKDTIVRDTFQNPQDSCVEYFAHFVSAEFPQEKFLTPRVLCPTDTVHFEGEAYGPFLPGSENLLTKTYQTTLGCDSLVKQIIFTLFENEDSTYMVVCPSDSAEFNGQKYPVGTFSFPTPNCGTRYLFVQEVLGDVELNISGDFNGQVGDSVPAFEVTANVIDLDGVATATSFKVWKVTIENSPCSQKWEDWASVTYCGVEYKMHRTVTLGWNPDSAYIEFPSDITLSVPDHIDSTSFGWWFENIVQSYEVVVPIPSGDFSLSEEIVFLNDTLARRDFVVAIPCDTFYGSQLITLRYPPAPPVVQCDVIVKLVGDVVVIDILKNVTDNGITLSEMKFTIWETRSGVTEAGDLKLGLNEIPLPINMHGFKMYIGLIRAKGSDNKNYIVVPKHHNSKSKGIGICRP